MKNSKKLLLTVISFLLAAGMASADTIIYGRLQTSGYSWQNQIMTEQSHFQLYQSLIFHVKKLGTPNLSFHTYMRAAHDFQDDDGISNALRIYNGYLQWQDTAKNLDIRMGRQFVHLGVGSTTLDGIKVSFLKRGMFEIDAMIGAQSPYSRKAAIQDFTGHTVIGGRIRTETFLKTRIGVSYIQKNSEGETSWQQMGFSVDKSINSQIFLLGKVDYNLDSKDIHEILLSGRYIQSNKFSIFSDLGRRKPRIDVDSYFTIFEPKPYDWFRVSSAFTVNRLTVLHADFKYTRFDSEQVSRAAASIDMDFITLGVSNQNGYGGSHLGVFGGINKDFSDKLSMAIQFNFSKYNIEEIIGDYENAFFSYFRINFIPIKNLRLAMNVQHLTNRQYKKDIRVLGTLSYSFRHGR